MSNTTLTAPTVLHLGAGSFHRAHQAWYLHRLNEKLPEGERWALAIGNIRNDMRETMDALEAQGGVYTLETVSPQGARSYETIRSIRHILPWTPDLAALADTGADPNCRIISFTVTEGGYYLDEHDRLMPTHPDLAADLEGACNTIYGALAAILARRMQRQAGKVTLQSCDNLRRNGTRFRAGMREFLQRRKQSSLLAWFDAHTTCPCAMVDRITPRPTKEVRDRVRAVTGVDDACPVMSESFAQWVIEDRFIAGRPAWELAGATLVADVHPYEEAKLRILNATHSCLAWAGTLAGHVHIRESTHDPSIRRFAYDYITDGAIPCLKPSPVDLIQYRDSVLGRFGNPHILDTNQRVAADGFSKIPSFIAPTLLQLLERNADAVSTAVLPALFLRFLQRWALGELPYTYQDGAMDEGFARAIAGADDPVTAFAASKALWGPQAGDSRLERVLREGLARVDRWRATLSHRPVFVSHHAMKHVVARQDARALLAQTSSTPWASAPKVKH